MGLGSLNIKLHVECMKKNCVKVDLCSGKCDFSKAHP